MRTKLPGILRAAAIATLLGTLAAALAAFAMQTGRPVPKSGPMEMRIDPDLQGRLQRFEAQLEALRQEQHLPGLSVAVVKNQEVVYLKGLGSASDGQSATPDTVYPVRSLIRPFGHPWTVRDLAGLDVVLDRGGVPELQPYFMWYVEDSGGTRLQWAWEHEKAGSVFCLKAREKRLTLILVANGEIEKDPFAAAFRKAFF
jgi:hypothetical protein